MIASLAGQGFDVQRACLMLGVSESGYYDWKNRPPSGSRRQGPSAASHEKPRNLRTTKAAAAQGRAKIGKASSADLVRRRFTADGPDRLWMTDITEHPTREGKIYCCAVIDAFSRMVWRLSIDQPTTGLLVTNALGMALSRRSRQGAIIRSDQGVQFGSWVFSKKVTDAGVAPSVGAVGAPFDNAMVEAFWARMQVELLNRQRWRTRVELATAIHDYIEIWHKPTQTTQRPADAHANRVREPTPTTTERRLIPDRRLQESHARSNYPRKRVHSTDSPGTSMITIDPGAVTDPVFVPVT